MRTLQPRNLDGGQVRGVLYHALEVWAKHSKLTFQELNSDRADILVYFHRLVFNTKRIRLSLKKKKEKKN